MTRDATFPPRTGMLWLTEGGVETEALYKHGYELPEFAMYPLLEDPGAAAVLRGMYRRYLDAAAAHGLAALAGGFDYRASPDWARKLGYSEAGLVEVQHRCIDFLRALKAEYADDLPDFVEMGYLGPRGDAYGTGGAITEDEAEDYHAVQLATLKNHDVPLACAMTFNNVPEAIGALRAADAIGIPLAVSFTLTSEARLRSGPSLRQAVEAVLAADVRPAFLGINCSHPVEFEPALDGGDWQRHLRWVRPNAAAMDKIALCKLGHLEDGDPLELGRQIGDVARRFPEMDIFGGCCGTDERHLGEIARNVREVREGVPAT